MGYISWMEFPFAKSTLQVSVRMSLFSGLSLGVVGLKRRVTVAPRDRS